MKLVDQSLKQAKTLMGSINCGTQGGHHEDYIMCTPI